MYVLCLRRLVQVCPPSRVYPPFIHPYRELLLVEHSDRGFRCQRIAIKGVNKCEYVLAVDIFFCSSRTWPEY